MFLELLDQVRERVRQEVITQSQSKLFSESSLLKFTVTVENAKHVPPTTLLGTHADSFVMIKVMSVTGVAMSEVQTRNAVGSEEPDWSESLYFEVSEKPAEPESVDVQLFGYNPVGLNTLIGQIRIDWASWKESADSQNSACWLLKGEILDNTEIPIFLRVDTGSDHSPRKVRFAQQLQNLPSTVTTRYARDATVSQTQARSRYWRHQADLDEQDLEDSQALKRNN